MNASVATTTPPKSHHEPDDEVDLVAPVGDALPTWITGVTTIELADEPLEP